MWLLIMVYRSDRRYVVRKATKAPQSKGCLAGLALAVPGTRRYGPLRSFASFDSGAVFEFGQLLLRETLEGT